MATPYIIPAQLPLPLEGETVEIRLRTGDSAIVDAVDGDLCVHGWGLHCSGHNKYAQASINKRHSSMHRFVMERVLDRQLKQGEIVDHINGNSLDNRRSNLRLATHQQNIHNQRRNSRNTSGYKGVSYARRMNKWLAKIKINGKCKSLGYYVTPEEAFAAYCAAAKEAFGDFARFE